MDRSRGDERNKSIFIHNEREPFAEEKLFFLYGSGANGKSKFLEILTYIWNDYATRIAPSTLLN